MPGKAGSQLRRAQGNANKQDWMPLPALGGLAAGLFPAYLVAETVLVSSGHPLHWVVAAAARPWGI